MPAPAAAARRANMAATALVTGASRGIGAATARELARRGCRVIVTGRSVRHLDGLVSEIEQAGGKAIPLPADLSTMEGAQSLIDGLNASTATVDIFASCAGIAKLCHLADETSASVAETMQINLIAPMLVTKAVSAGMVERRRGRIIYVASMFGMVSAGAYSAYTASKAGLIGLTKSLAIEFARYGIQVNAVAPGHVRTAMLDDVLSTPAGEERLVRPTPMRRIAEVGEIVNVLAYLALDAPAFLTGETVTVDGGYTCR